MTATVATLADTSPAGLPDEAFVAALAVLDGMTSARLRALLRGRTGRQAWQAVVEDWADETLDRLAATDPGLRARWRVSTLTCDLVESAWSDCRRLGVHVLVWGRAGYPLALLHDPSPPPVLFARGNLAALETRRVGIVGTRNATPGGRRMARALGRELAEAGVGVVSGLARGIDGAAHLGVRDATDHGGAGPIAVVGSGPDVVFPREHRELWEWIATDGLLLTEYPPGTTPLPAHFPQRNRVIAGLSELLVVVESRATGGSLITVREAIKRGVDVLAVPGSLMNRAAQGTNQLIAEGARAVLEPSDVLIALGLDTRRTSSLPFDPRVEPATGDRVVLAAFEADTLTIDELVARTGNDTIATALAVGRLEAGGWLLDIGGWYAPVDHLGPWS